MNPPAGDAGNSGSIPGLGRSPGEGNGNQNTDTCLGNPLDRGAWRATVHGGPGIEPASLKTLALAGRLFTTNATWEAQIYLLLLLSHFSHV